MRAPRTSRGWQLSLAVGCALASLLLVPAAGAGAPSFSAHGSVEQVYVTGLEPHAKMTLLDSSGRTVATKHADPQGGLLFRHVKPGNGYRVRLGHDGPKSRPLRVLSKRPAPPAPSSTTRPSRRAATGI